MRHPTTKKNANQIPDDGAPASAALLERPDPEVEARSARTALFEYYRDNRAPLLRYVRNLTRDPDLAEDLIQQAVVNTIEAIERGTTVANIGGWLNRCIRNLYLDHVRRTPVSPVADTTLIQNRQGDPAQSRDLADARERWRAVERVVDTLPERQRTAFLLAEVRGLNNKEIASILQRSVPAVAQILRRARVHVRGVLSGDRAPGIEPALGAKLAASVQPEPPTGEAGGGVARLQHWLAGLADRVPEFVASPAVSFTVAAALAVVPVARPPAQTTSAGAHAEARAPIDASTTPGAARPSAPARSSKTRRGHDGAARVPIGGGAPRARPFQPGGSQGRTGPAEPRASRAKGTNDAATTHASAGGGRADTAGAADSPVRTVASAHPDAGGVDSIEPDETSGVDAVETQAEEPQAQPEPVEPADPD